MKPDLPGHQLPLLACRLSWRQRGFSLIELVMVTVLIGIVAVSSVEPLRQAFAARQQLADSLQTLAELRYATERIARELKQTAWQPGAGLAMVPIEASAASSAGLCFTRIGSSPEAAQSTVVVRGSGAGLMFDHVACAAMPARSLLGSSSAVRFDFYTLNPVDGSKIALLTTASDFRSRLRYVDITVSCNVAGGTLTHRTGILLRNGFWGEGARVSGT